MNKNINLIEKEDYVVYDCLIKSLCISEKTKQIVVYNQTSDYLGEKPNEILKMMTIGSRMKRFNISMEKADNDTVKNIITDYKIKNQLSYPLKNHFNLAVDTILISKNQFQVIYDKKGWEGYYQEYASPLITLSRVGFNTNKTEAITYVGVQAGHLSGSGKCVILIKEQSKWYVQFDFEVWVS